jgi:hypothetical protein
MSHTTANFSKQRRHNMLEALHRAALDQASRTLGMSYIENAMRILFIVAAGISAEHEALGEKLLELVRPAQ